MNISTAHFLQDFGDRLMFVATPAYTTTRSSTSKTDAEH